MSFVSHISRQFFRGAAAIIVGLVTASSLPAASFTWNGADGKSDGWTKGGNWAGGNAPGNVATTDLIFGTSGAGNTSNTQDFDDGTKAKNPVAFTLNSLIFSNVAASYHIDGNQIIFGGASAKLVQNSANAQVISNTLALNVATTVSGAGAGNLTLAGVISGAGNLTNSFGRLILAGNNIFTGATIINSGGVITILHANALGNVSAGTTVNSGGALQIQGGITTVAEQLTLNGTGVSAGGALRNVSGNNSFAGALTLGSAARINSDAGTLTLSSATAITSAFGLTLGGAGNVLVSSAINTGGNTLTKDGAGKVILMGANGYSGPTLISAGTLQIGNGSTAGTLGSGNVTNNSILAINRTDSVTVTNLIVGTGSLVQAGTGTTILSNNNAYSGITLISAGTLQVGTGDAAGSFGAGNVTNNGVLVFDRSDNVTVANPISGSGTLLKQGGNQLTLSGTNNYTGVTIISAGTVAISSASNLSRTASITFSNSQTATLYLTANGITLTNALVQHNFPGNYQIDAGNTGTFAGGVTGVGQFRKEGDGTIVMTGNYSATGKLVVNGGTFQFANSAYGSANMDAIGGTVDLGANSITIPTTLTLGTSSTMGTITGAGVITVNSAVAARNGVIGATLAGGAAFTKTTANTVTLTAANTFTGLTAINGGRLALANTHALQSTLVSNSSDGGLVFLVNSATFAGLAGTGDFGLTNAGTGVAVTLSNGSNNANTTYHGVMSGSGNLVKVGSGIFTLNGTNTYSGATTISQGQVVLANGVAVTNSTVTVNTNGGLVFSNAPAFLVGGLAGSSNVGLTNIAGAAVALSAGNNNANTTFGGVLSGAGSLVKVGTGILTLTNNNTYTGLTSVNAGELDLNSSGTALAGNLVINGGAAKLLASQQLGGTASISVNGGSFNLNGFNQTLAQTIIVSGGLLTNGVAGATLGGSVTNAGMIFVSQATYFNGAVTNTGSLFFTGAISNNLISSGTVKLNNNATITGTASITAGMFDLNGKILTNGLMVVSSGAVVTNSLANATLRGALNLLNGTLTGAAISNDGYLSGRGTISAVFANNGTLTAESGGQLIVRSTLTQNGQVEIDGTLNVTTGWTNGAAGVVRFNGGILTGGTFTVAGTVQGNGTLAANALLRTGEQITVSGGNLNLTAVTTMRGGMIAGSDEVINYGTISGFGDINLTVQNPGYIRATNGTLFIQSLSGNQATGTLEASANGTLQANGIQSWINDGRVILSGGTVIGGIISNNTANFITGYGTIATSLINSGTLQANASGRTLTLDGPALLNANTGIITANNQNLIVNSVFTNNGTFSMIGGRATFNNLVVNNGAWITDPMTNVFNFTETHSASGYLSADVGDVFHYRANLVNQSRSNAFWNTLNVGSVGSLNRGTEFIFDGDSVGGAGTQQFFHAGLNLSGGFMGSPSPTATGVQDVSSFSAVTGFVTNFALGTLEIGSAGTNSILRLANAFGTVDAANGNTGALFVNTLNIFGTSKLIISNNFHVYFVHSNNWSMANITLLAGAQIHQLNANSQPLAVIPEPHTLMLWLAGAVTLAVSRKRFRKKTS